METGNTNLAINNQFLQRTLDPGVQKDIPDPDIKDEVQEINQKEKPNNDSADVKNLHDTVHNIFSKSLLPITSFGSVAINLISAPVRLYKDENPLKKLINKVSMFATKSHLLTYAASGINNAVKSKNPLLLFSFAVEGMSALFDLRKIYLFRGIASGIDGAVAGIQDRYKNQGKETDHSSFSESFKDYFSEIKTVTKEFFDSPYETLTRSDGVHKGVISSWGMIFGSIFGLGVNDTVGAGLRDATGAINDYSLIEYKSRKAQKAGGFYLSGSIIDFVAHTCGFNENSKPFRDVFHEIAIALDRIGQFWFMRYLEEEKTDAPKEVQKVIKPKEQELDANKKLHEMDMKLAA